MSKTTLHKEPRPVYRRRCTDLELHAFVDGELTIADHDFVLESASRSAKVREKINKLEQLKQLIRSGYAEL